MSRTRSSYIPIGVVTRGLGAIRPSGGVGRASRGWVLDYPNGIDESIVDLDPIPLLSTLAFDKNGVQRLLSNDIRSLDFAHASRERFANPDREYTGYAANGFWYTNGVADPTHVPFKATWATEGEGSPGDNRSDLDRMPARLIIAATRAEVAIFDADSLTLWMRFVVGVTPPPGNGAWAGAPSCLIREVRYSNGILVAATSEGLRVADFRKDVGYLLGDSAAYGSGTAGLATRNEETFFDATSSVNTNFLVQNTECTSVDLRTFSISVLTSGSTKDSRTVAAVGHPDGITAIQLDNPDFSVVRTRRHPSVLSVPNGWEIEDDFDGDSTSPFFVDDNFNATLWESLGAQKGDTLVTDTGLTLTITEVDQIQGGRRLWVSPEVSVSATGASYSITKRVSSVLLSPELHLYFANGVGGVGVVRDQSWVTTSNFIFSTLNVASNEFADLAAPVESINDLARRGDQCLIATSEGVFGVSDTELAAQRTAGFLYSTQSVSVAEASYKILFGDDKNCSAISVDPETGNIMVAVTDVDSVVTEINPNTQQAFRYFDNVGRVKALVAYRNPEGPPDEEAP